MKIKTLPSIDYRDLDRIAQHRGMDPGAIAEFHQGMLLTVPTGQPVKLIADTFRKEVEAHLEPMFKCRLATPDRQWSGRLLVGYGRAATIIDANLDYQASHFSLFVSDRENGKALCVVRWKGEADAIDYLAWDMDRYATNPGLAKASAAAMTSLVMFTIAVDMFCLHAEVRTIELGPRLRRKVGGQKHLNETDSAVQLYDSRYFTDSLGKPFPVSGHMRMQPFGPGKQFRRPTWIAPYTKGGVHRKAGIRSAKP